jgi:single-strand DNA-binding protein
VTEDTTVINRVILVGNLTADAEAMATNSGKAMTRMRLATNRRWQDEAGNRQEAAEFHALVTFGRLAEVCALYCTKGRRVYIEGRLRSRDFEDRDGIRRYTTEIVAETVKLLQARKQADAAGAVGERA